MLAALPAGRFEVFSGARKLRRITPYSALVHADPQTADLAELIGEMSDRTSSGYLWADDKWLAPAGQAQLATLAVDRAQRNPF